MTTESKMARPLPWRQVALAVVPGAFALVVASGLPREVGPATRMAELMVLCMLLVGVGLLRQRRLSAWSFGAAGVVLSGAMYLATAMFAGTDIGSVIWPLLAWGGVVYYLAHHDVPGRAWFLLCLLLVTSVVSLAVTATAAGENWRAALETTVGLELWWTAMLIVPVVAGMPLARGHGLAAGLLVAAAEFALVTNILDLNYGPRIAASSHAAHLALALMPAACFLMAPAAWLLRARSARERAAALVVPGLTGLAAGVGLCLAGLWGNGTQPGPELVIGPVQVGLALAAAAIIYRAADEQDGRPQLRT